MSSERWERTKQMLEAALRLAPESRSAFLETECGLDHELRVEVESLIASYEKAGSQFLKEAAPKVLDLTAFDNPRSMEIGNYRLVEEIGHGGMGQVWLAEQTAPVRRQVALKLIRGGMYDGEILKRFEMERQSLAIMDHPSIAKVFDAGVTPAGQPYFVMEYVPGVPITEYCDQKRLKIRERLELFIKVCEGVQHAHQKAILHRDLKPANILVQEVDGKPLPRIIDFGLAKATSTRLTGESLHTQAGGFVGTPGYMSPEQCDPAAPEVDTSSDAYSLGVVLYVLLTGCQPFQPGAGKEQTIDELLRRVREDEPPPPSAKVLEDEPTSAIRAETRNAEPQQLANLLRGDLDWITMKALEKDRRRRYGTALELAVDVQRCLNHEPVLARPASVSYRVQKYARRHRVGVAVAAGLALVLAVFAAMQTIELRRITRERDRETRITEFMTKMFKVADPTEARGNSITAREILDKASKEIDSGLEKDPEVQAHMMYVMAGVYNSLGLFSPARTLARRAVEIQRRVLGAANPETLRSASLLGIELSEEENNSEAETLERETLAVQRRVIGLEGSDTLRTMSWLAIILRRQARFAEAEKLYREVLEIQRRVPGTEHPDTLFTMTDLAWALYTDAQAGESTDPTAKAKAGEAEKLAREALTIQKRVLGADHPDVLTTLVCLAAILQSEGSRAEAEQIELETIEVSRRVLGPEHVDTLVAMNNLAVALGEDGSYAEAEKLYLETRVIQVRVLGPHHPDTALSTYNLGCLAAVQGHREQAFSLLDEAVSDLKPELAVRLEHDDDLKSLHGDPRFDALVAHAKQLASTKHTQ